MNLAALYALLAARTNPNGSIRLPTWQDIVAAAEVGPLEDAAALRALIEKGAVDRVTVRNTYGDCNYVLRRPMPEYADAWSVSLRTVGASVRGLVQPLPITAL